MPNIYIGTDIVSVQRIQNALKRHPDRFQLKIYTHQEIDYCSSKANPEIHYSGRFAAKEAILKALYSSGHKDKLPFNAVDVRSGEDGEPLVTLPKNIKGNCKVSISHTSDFAVAFAIYTPKT